MAAPAPGDRISKELVLVRPLIQGGMGEVWVAHHSGRGHDVALKLLSRGLVDDDVARARFAREAQSAREVQSPHVVQMLDYGISDQGAPYLVMELLSGEDLEAQLANGPLPARDVVSVVTQVGHALEHVHQQKIIHRDVKPANVFLVRTHSRRGDTYLVKLLDFGFAKRMDKSATALTEQGMIVGTPHYMSPEQMMGQKLDLRSDLFSLAAVAFEAFTGKRAFPGKTLQEIDDAIQKRPIPSPSHYRPELPRALDAWFAKAMARDRDDRFKSASDMIAALQKVFEHLEGPASEEAAPHARVVAPRSSGSPWKPLLFALLVVLAVAAALWRFQP